MIHRRIVMMQQTSKAKDAYSRFMYSLNAKETKRQYPKRFDVFLRYLDLNGDDFESRLELFFEAVTTKGREWIETQLIEFFSIQNKRAENGEIAISSIRNFYKPVKLYCDVNGILLNWKFISKGINNQRQISEDRIPTMSEIQKLCEYPDRRIKPIVLLMLSSGMRVSSLQYLKWKHIQPIKSNDFIVGAKVIIFNTKSKKNYFSFITTECYQVLEEWLEFRKSFGEKITGESPVIRDRWKINSSDYSQFIGLAQFPKKMLTNSIRNLLNDAWKIQGLREEIKTGNRYEFKASHSFRKFFETQCQKVMKSLHVSLLMGHDTGIVAHYYRPNDDELLDDYLKAIDLLTINEENRLSKEVDVLKKKNQEKDHVIEIKLQERDDAITALSDQVLKLIQEIDKLKEKP